MDGWIWGLGMQTLHCVTDCSLNSKHFPQCWQPSNEESVRSFSKQANCFDCIRKHWLPQLEKYSQVLQTPCKPTWGFQVQPIGPPPEADSGWTGARLMQKTRASRRSEANIVFVIGKKERISKVQQSCRESRQMSIKRRLRTPTPGGEVWSAKWQYLCGCAEAPHELLQPEKTLFSVCSITLLNHWLSMRD